MHPMTGLAAMVATGLLVVCTPLAAATIVQCEDSDGERFYADSCPAGSKQVEQKNFYTGPRGDGEIDMAALQREHPVTLYSVPACDACDLVRNYLNQRGVPFAETDVSTDAEQQETLIAKSGELSVPVVTIGEQIVTGYNKPTLRDRLDSAGYPAADTETDTPASAGDTP